MSVLSQNISRNTSRMAAVIVDRTLANGCCTEADLLSAGFAWSQIAVLVVDARRMAGEELRQRNFTAAA